MPSHSPFHPPRAPRNFKSERASERKPFKPKPWSHQRDLEALKGKKIEVLYSNGVSGDTGILLEADQFALKLELDAQTYKSVVTVFKHNILHYRVLA